MLHFDPGRLEVADETDSLLGLGVQKQQGAARPPADPCRRGCLGRSPGRRAAGRATTPRSTLLRFFCLRRLSRKSSDERLALAAYNAGQANVDEWLAHGDGVAFPETREYVEDVLETREIYARAYADELSG